jgi:hypothetical protein
VFAECTARNGTKILNLWPYKTTVVHSLLPPDSEARIRYCRWFQESVFKGLLDSELTSYSDEAWYTLSGYVNSQNNRYWTIENPYTIHEMSLHDLNLGFGVQLLRGGQFCPRLFTINSILMSD